VDCGENAELHCGKYRRREGDSEGRGGGERSRIAILSAYAWQKKVLWHRQNLRRSGESKSCLAAVGWRREQNQDRNRLESE